MTQYDSDRVPDREWYSAEYLGEDFGRLSSYRHQLNFALRSNPASALLVGKGDGLVVNALRGRNLHVTVLDLEATLQPDILATVEKIPVADASFDVAVCCQVLEHLPFDQLAPTLKEIARVTRDRLVLSLPDVRRCVSVNLTALDSRFQWQFTLPRFTPPAMPESRREKFGHEWEIGYKGYPLSRVRDAIKTAGWSLLDVQRVPELPWHTFLYCSKTA